MAISRSFFKAGISVALAAGLGLAALAAPAKAGIEVTGASLRAPIVSGRPGVAYFTIANSGPAADRLLAIQSPVIGQIEIHQSMMEGDMMTMKPVAALDIPAGGKVVFEPGSYHAMLFDVNEAALKKGTAPLILTFEKAGKITVEARITTMGSKEYHKH